MKVLLLPLLLLFSFNSQAQKSPHKKQHYYRFAISNSHTAKPFGSFSSLLYKNFHPGFEISKGKILSSKNKHEWLAEITVSYLWHRWVQHNLGLSLNGGYRYLPGKNWGASVKLGAGYQVSMPTDKVYAITRDGLKEKGHVVRSQIIAAFSIGADKKIGAKGIKAFIEYQQKIQTPFIKEYVPLLPYNTLLAGVTIPIHKRNNK